MKKIKNVNKQLKKEDLETVAGGLTKIEPERGYGYNPSTGEFIKLVQVVNEFEVMKTMDKGNRINHEEK